MQLGGEILREPHAGLGRLGRELERPDHAADAERQRDVLEPVLGCLVLLGCQGLLELGGQGPGRLVAGDGRIVTGSDDGAEIAQIELGEIGLGGIRPVQPLGDAQTREHLLGHLEHAGSRNLFLALGTQ